MTLGASGQAGWPKETAAVNGRVCEKAVGAIVGRKFNTSRGPSPNLNTVHFLLTSCFLDWQYCTVFEIFSAAGGPLHVVTTLVLLLL